MNNYLSLLLETNKTARMMNFLIAEYLLEKRISCNISQVVTLHLLQELGGNGSPHELREDINAFSRNNTCNYQALIKNGYMSQRKGSEVGLDGRAIFFQITPKGKQLYKDVCDYVEEKLVQMKSGLEWDDENLLDYMADLIAIQHFLKNR